MRTAVPIGDVVVCGRFLDRLREGRRLMASRKADGDGKGREFRCDSDLGRQVDSKCKLT